MPADARRNTAGFVSDRIAASDEWTLRHRATLWAHQANLLVAAWLIAAPAAIGGGSRLLAWSDVISGALLALFAALSLSPRRLWAPWGAAVVGLWLLAAPLVLWAPTAAEYTNDTLCGTLAIVFALLLPGLPGLHEAPGPDVPPGWSYNPSAALQRAPIVALAFVGFLISRSLAAYQLGHVDSVWDPLFPGGTRAVLESEVSRAWPVSDAGLGALSYLLEALTGCFGSRRRWRTMPWLVIVFGILVVPLGITSIVLIVLQPIAVGAWCTLCLLTAAIMLVMISPALDEVIATVQFLRASRRSGQPLWRAFLLGGAAPAAGPQAAVRPRRGLAGLVDACGLSHVPWNLAASAALGVWLMCAPTALGTGGAAADSDHLAGAVLVTFAVIAWDDVARAARLFNLLVGAWLVVAPWILGGTTRLSLANGIVVGLLLMALSLRRGRVTGRFGTWDACVV